MKPVKQTALDDAVESGLITKVAIVERKSGGWYLKFKADDLISGDQVQYILRATRGEIRTWKDPRFLLRFLRVNYGIYRGEFDSEYNPDILERIGK